MQLTPDGNQEIVDLNQRRSDNPEHDNTPTEASGHALPEQPQPADTDRSASYQQADAYITAALTEPNTETPAQYSSVTPSEAAKFFRLRQTGLTIEQIAHLCVRSTETVHRHLQMFVLDTVDQASVVLKAGALDAALRTRELIECEQPKVALEASKAILSANQLLGNAEGKVTVGVQVVIGMPSQPDHTSAV